MTDIFGMQLETIEAIIVALGTSFVGTGTVALIVKVALNKVTKSMTEKVLLAEQQNKISTKSAQQSLDNIRILEDGLRTQIDMMQKTIDRLVDNQSQTNRSMQDLIDEYRARDAEIKELIVKEFGDDIE